MTAALIGLTASAADEPGAWYSPGEAGEATVGRRYRDREISIYKARRSPSSPAALVAALATGTKYSAREKAAKAILAHEPVDEVPSFARYGASIIIAESCEELEEKVDLLIKLGDERGVPVLKRLSADNRKCKKGKKSIKCGECLSDAHKALIKGMKTPE